MKRYKKSLLGQTVRFLTGKFDDEPLRETKFKVISFTDKTRSHYNVRNVKAKKKIVVEREALDKLFLIQRKQKQL